MNKFERLNKIFIKIKETRIYWFPVFVFFGGILFAYFILPSLKPEPFRPVLAVAGVAAPVYSFPIENINGQDVPGFLIDNPGQAADYKWQFRLDGVFVLIDRQDELGWQVLAENISVIPEYFSSDDKLWQAYEKTSTSSALFVRREGEAGEMIIERVYDFKLPTGSSTSAVSDISETLTETWRLPTSPDNQKLKAPKAEFKMTKNADALWRLKWVFAGLAGIAEDSIDIKDENGWPIRTKKYSNNEFTIDVDDFDNLENSKEAFSFSEYASCDCEGGVEQNGNLEIEKLRNCLKIAGTRGAGENCPPEADQPRAGKLKIKGQDNNQNGIVEIIFYPTGTDGERSIDPVLASTGIGTGWTDSKQRNIFHNGDYFFLLYTDGAGKLYYRTATSSVWSATSTLVTDMSVTDQAFDLFAVDDATIDLAYISNSAGNVYVRTCTTSAASLACGATTTPFAAAVSVAVTRTGHNRIWAAGRGTDNKLLISSANLYGQATSGTSWRGEATSTVNDLAGEVSLAPFIDLDRILAVFPVNPAGSVNDEIKATAITRAVGYTASSTLTNWNSADIDISGLVWISDNDFRILARNNTAATGTSEFKFDASAWTTVDSSIDAGNELDGTNPSLAAVTDQSTTTLYALLIDAGSGDLELYRKTYSGVWNTESVANGAESGTRSLPVVAMADVPVRADRPSPRELPFAYRLANGAAYDLYVGSIGLAPKIVSSADQSFAAASASSNFVTSPIRVVNCSSSTMITATSDIRIRIASSSANLQWSVGDTSATITGSASGKVNATVSYEGVYTLKIDVTSDFAPWEEITISDLTYANYASVYNGNFPNPGVLRLYLNGASDMKDEARDLKTVAIYGRVAIANHTMGQLENQWSALSATSSTYHYRFKATPNSEPVNIGTTTFALSGISGVSTADIVSAKLYYDGNGNGNMAENDWANSGLVTYNGGGGDYARAITIDSANNIFVAGNQANDLMVRSYNSNGLINSSWGGSGSRTYDSGSTDSAYAVVLDNQNNIYVAGFEQTFNSDWVIRKYTSTGAIDTGWGTAGMINYSKTNLVESAKAIAIDSEKNIYVAGTQGTGAKYWVIQKYSSVGTLDTNWGNFGLVSYYIGNDYANAITIDNEKNIYVAGYHSTNGNDWVVRKYTNVGILDTNWGTSGMVTYNSGSSQNDQANAITVDSQKNIYVAGFQNNSDWAIRKYNSNGILDTNWGSSGTVTYSNGGVELAYAITIDNLNNIYVGGMDSSGTVDMMIRKYDRNGNLDTSWGNSGYVTYNSGAQDYAYGLVVDSQNNVYAAGAQQTNSYDWAIRKYDPSGQIDIYRDTFYMSGDVNIAGTDGIIVFATSAPYKVTKATDFLLELTVANIAVGDKMTIDYSTASSTGVRSRLPITPTGDPSALTHRVGAEISSASNQVFALGQATTSISAITITDRGGVITAANNIKITIDQATHGFLWNYADTTASISGSASGKVSTTISSSVAGWSAIIVDVTSDFSPGDSITISDLSFRSFTKIGKNKTGVLKLYLDGGSDVSQDGLDDKTIAVTAGLTVAEHTLAQEKNKWSALSSTADGTHYRFRLTSTGETTQMQNALFDFSGITGVVTNDITNAFLYADMNRDGYYGYSIPEAWYLGFDSTTAEYTSSLIVDTVNGVVYAGQAVGSGDGDIYYCQPRASGDADGICEGGEFTKSFEGAQEYIWAMAIDTRSGTLYAGQGSGAGDGDIYKCNPNLDGDMDGICETTGSEWVKSYEGSEEYILSLAYDSDNSIIYAGQGSGSTDGNIYYCAPYQNGDQDGICETGEWYGSYNGDQEMIDALVYEPFYNVVYAGQGNGAGDGDIYYCRPNADGDADGICEYGEWTKSWEGAQEYVVSLNLDNINNVVYAGQGSGAGDGDVYYCKPGLSGDADGLCETGEWTQTYNSTIWGYAWSMAFDPGQKAMYMGGSYSSGYGDIYRCLANTDGDADGICESGEWSTYAVFDGGQEYITSLAVDPVNGVVYAGQGSGSGDGDIYYYSTGDYKISATGTVAISGSAGTISFSTTSPWYVSGATDYIIQLNGASIASGDALTIDWNGASTTGVSTAGTAVMSGNPTSAAHRVAVTLGTAANQTFAYNGASTAISPLTITDVSGVITSANNIRVTIATTSVNMRWDSADTSASISGTASGKVSGTVSYADGDATLVIDVTSNFSAGEAITVSGLNFKSFNTVNYPYQAGLELYLSGAGIRNQDGRNANTIAIYGTAAVSNHALGAITNTWQPLNENMSDFMYRYRVTPSGENLNIGTTTISLPSFKGFSASDISNVVLYYDANGDGGLTDGAWGDSGSGMIVYDSGSSQNDQANAVAIDSQNNIYVVGYQSTNGIDWAIRKYTSAGILDTDWGLSGMVTYNSGASQNDSAQAITIDSQNNIYVAGYQGTNVDWAILKYDASGQIDTSWGSAGMITYNSSASKLDRANAITIDSQNNIYVVGYQGTNGWDWSIRKYTSAGILDTDWGTAGMLTYNSGASQIDSAQAITIDSQNNLYVAGYQGTNGDDWAIRKYTSAGILDTSWGSAGILTYNSGASQIDDANAITIDSQKNIYVAGFQQTNGDDWAIRKYTSAGILDTSWGSAGLLTYDSGASQQDFVQAITIDSRNNIYVAGYQGTNGDDWAIRKYTSAGILDTSWGATGMVTYNSGTSQFDYTKAITIDSRNNIYVAGYQGTNGNDWAIRKYDAYGNFGTYTDGPAANGAAIDITNGVGTITLATSSAYRISQATDFLLKMTLSNVGQAEELKIDFGAMSAEGFTSSEPIIVIGDPGLSHFYKPEFSLEGTIMFEGDAYFE